VSAQAFAIVSAGQVLQRSERDDARRVYVVVGRVVVPLDVIEIDRRRDLAKLLEIA
jgi:hypothetical protein